MNLLIITITVFIILIIFFIYLFLVDTFGTVPYCLVNVGVIKSRSILLTFKEFTDYYYIAPEKYEILRHCYFGEEGCPTITYETDGRRLEIGFINVIEFYKFCKWFEQKEDSDKKLSTERLQRLNTKIFLESVQRDIGKLREQSNYELNTACDTLNRSVN